MKMAVDILNSVFVPIVAIFGIIEWVIVFLETYRHFPRMEKQKRIMNSVYDATLMTVTITAITYFFLYLILQILQP